MRHMHMRLRGPSPAFVISVIALFVALGGTTYAAATSLPINSVGTPQLKAGAVTPAKLASATTALLEGSIVNYNANATVSPTVKTLGTFLGDTFGASCQTTAGDAELHLWVKTSNGSWIWDAGIESNTDRTPGVDAIRETHPAGTYSTSSKFATWTAAAGGHTTDTHMSFIQTAPVAGSMTWHSTVSTANTPSTCHFALETSPETITSITG
jgi:hypothetical protein